MLTDDVSRIYFNKFDYRSLSDMFEDVGRQIEILTNTNNTVMFYKIQALNGVYVLEFSPIGLDEIVELDATTQLPCWLTIDELTALEMMRETADKIKEKQEEKKKETPKKKDDKFDA